MGQALYRKYDKAPAGNAFAAALEAATANQVVEVWPENWPAVSVFLRVSTQWRIGMNGPSGLDYNVLPLFLDMTAEDSADTLDDIATLERAALEAMHEE